MSTESSKLILALKSFIKSSDMTYAELAKKIKVSEPTIKRMLGGKSQITLSKIENICDILIGIARTRRCRNNLFNIGRMR